MKITDCLINVVEFFGDIIDPPETWRKHPKYPWILLSSKGYWKLILFSIIFIYDTVS